MPGRGPPKDHLEAVVEFNTQNIQQQSPMSLTTLFPGHAHARPGPRRRREADSDDGGSCCCTIDIIFTPSQNPAPGNRNLNIKIIIDYYRVKKLLPGNANA